MESTLVGFWRHFLSWKLLVKMSFEIMFEAQTGTFEQMCMSAVSPLWVITAQVVAVHNQIAAVCGCDGNVSGAGFSHKLRIF